MKLLYYNSAILLVLFFSLSSFTSSYEWTEEMVTDEILNKLEEDGFLKNLDTREFRYLEAEIYDLVVSEVEEKDLELGPETAAHLFSFGSIGKSLGKIGKTVGKTAKKAGKAIVKSTKKLGSTLKTGIKKLGSTIKAGAKKASKVIVQNTKKLTKGALKKTLKATTYVGKTLVDQIPTIVDGAIQLSVIALPIILERKLARAGSDDSYEPDDDTCAQLDGAILEKLKKIFKQKLEEGLSKDEAIESLAEMYELSEDTIQGLLECAMADEE